MALGGVSFLWRVAGSLHRPFSRPNPEGLNDLELAGMGRNYTPYWQFRSRQVSETSTGSNVAF
jgi:hypothetical protein